MLNYKELIQKYPWIIEESQNCILSPDSDGLLCGLFMSHYLGWHVKGFYDGNVLVHEENIDPKQCVFLDMEIFRPGVRSIGQHMVIFDKNNVHPNCGNFGSCISPNNLRGLDYKNDFARKYPFGTIHLLLSIVGQRKNIPIEESAICLLLYTDGTFKNQFNYPENCISWLEFMGANQENSPLQRIFLDRNYSTYELMVELNDLFRAINEIGGGKRGGDKIKISNSKGLSPAVDLDRKALSQNTEEQACSFLAFISKKTRWEFRYDHWTWNHYRILQFESGNIKPGKARYNDLFAKNPLSIAITSGENLSYTLDIEKKF